tara:strand:- start:168298 stop:168864 length:567 start_codon:yes stop_codon:yes gene_type:complete
MAKDSRVALQKILDSHQNRISENKNYNQVAVQKISQEKISIGDTVWVKSISLEGKVIEKRGNRYRIQTKTIVITALITDLIRHNPSAKTNQRRSRKSFTSNINLNGRSLLELNVRGYRVADAIDALDHHLDQTVLDDLDKIRILHGKGTGALASAIHEFLEHHPWVRSYHFAEQRDGGIGVTIAIMAD